MKTICITILIYFFSWGMSNGQTIKINYGRDWSKLKWYIHDEYIDYTETLKGNVFFLGIDFLNKKYFNLNANVGYLQKQGEKSYVVYGYNYSQETINGKTSFEQITLNTKLIFKYPIKEKFIPFMCIGPSVDFLISNTNEDDRISSVESNMFGLLLGGGINYCISKFQIGLNVDYCQYFSYFAHLESRPSPWMTGFDPAEDIKSQTIISSISIGYRIK